MLKETSGPQQVLRKCRIAVLGRWHSPELDHGHNPWEEASGSSGPSWARWVSGEVA